MRAHPEPGIRGPASVTNGRSEKGAPDGESREKLAKICDRTVVVLDGFTIVAPLLDDKGLAIAMITRLLALGLRIAAKRLAKR
jgi:hypothetical protein